MYNYRIFFNITTWVTCLIILYSSIWHSPCSAGYIIEIKQPRIAAGYEHSLYIDNNGTAWAWGFFYGLGLPYQEAPVLPYVVADKVKSVFTGLSYSALIRDDDTLWTWGNNYANALGNGSITKIAPVPSKILDDVKTATVSADRGFAIRKDNSLWGWGEAGYGMGIKSKKNISAPRKILERVMHVTAATDFTLALRLPEKKGDNVLSPRYMAWGRNDCGQLGNVNNYNKTILTPREGNINFEYSELDEGEYFIKFVTSGVGTVALTNIGHVWSWGKPGAYQCFSGLIPDDPRELQPTDDVLPQRIDWLEDIVDISLGGGTVVALKRDGTLLYDGWYASPLISNNSEAIPLNEENNRYILMTDVREMATGRAHALVIKNDGTVWAWGENNKGQLDGTTNTYDRPIQLIMPKADDKNSQ